MRRCPSCSADQPEGQPFCGACGSRLEHRCPACGAPAARADQRFCGECGAALDAVDGARLRRAGAPKRELRLVSVLFGDLVGYTALGESRDAEDSRELLEHYFSTSRRIIEAYGGGVEKFIGDAVVGFWGAPVAREDDAERAVRAALALVTAVGALGDGSPEGKLRVRVGVVTGEAAVDVGVGVHEGMVIGDTVSTASRLQSLAAPATVLVDGVTRRAAERAILFEDLGAHLVKGKRHPVHTWRAVRVVARRGGRGRDVGGVETPLVGRADELAVLRESVDELLRPGARLRVVTLLGAAGLGKTRLVWELEKHVDGLAAGVLWHRGRSLSFGEGLGVWAIADMVRMRARIAQDDDTATQLAKVGDLLDDVLSDADAERRRIGNAIIRLLGLDDGARQIERGELFAAWRELFERLSARTPVILVFEELQWADQVLLDFIVHVLEWSSDSSVLMLLVSRPDERVETLAEPFEHVRSDRLLLCPLSDAAMDELVAGTVEHAPRALLDQVRAHAGGVPLFAVETLRSLADRGVLLEREGRYVLAGEAGEVGELDVPATIHALIASRLDALGELEREVLLDGAVVGERFTAAAVGAVAGIDEHDARSLLDGLAARQLLVLDTDPQSPDRGHYAFLGGAVHRVALGTLARRDRGHRHLAAAEYLAASTQLADVAALLAGHLLAAAEADPHAVDHDVILERARRTMIEAAERAAAVGSFGEALSLFDRAADTEGEAERAAILERAGSVAYRADDWRAAAQRYQLARALHDRAGRQNEAQSARAHELRSLRYVKDPDELIGPLRELHAAVGPGGGKVRALTGSVLAFSLYQAGEPDEADRVASEAAVVAEQSGAFMELGGALIARASALGELGRLTESLALYRAALDVAVRHGLPTVPAMRGNIAVTLGALGRHHEAVEQAREAILAAEHLAERFLERWAKLVLARSLYALSEWDEARSLLEPLVDVLPPFSIGMATAPLLLIALARGEEDRARTLIADHDRRRAQAGASGFETDFRCTLEVAQAHLDGDPERAARIIPDATLADFAEWSGWLPLAVDLLVALPESGALDRARAALDRPAAPFRTAAVRAEVERLRAHLAQRAGDGDAAVEHSRNAQQLAREAANPFQVAVLTLEHAEVAASPQSDTQSALETFERLGATAWAQRARRSLRSAVSPAAP